MAIMGYPFVFQWTLKTLNLIWKIFNLQILKEQWMDTEIMWENSCDWFNGNGNAISLRNHHYILFLTNSSLNSHIYFGKQ